MRASQGQGGKLAGLEGQVREQKSKEERSLHGRIREREKDNRAVKL